MQTLAMRPTAETDLSIFGDDVHCAVTFRPDYDALSRRGRHLIEAATGPYDLALVFLTRHRNQNLAHIAKALQHLAPSGWLVLDGQKTDGIESLLKMLKKELQVDGVISKSHGKVIWLRRPDVLPETVAGWANLTDLTKNGDGFMTAPGLFSHEKIDEGTRFLADQFNAGLKGHAADLGAGWGAATSLLLQNAPEITGVDLFEADQDALNAAQSNITDPRATFHWSDVSALQAPEAGYNLVISNPPFHISRAAQPEIGAGFIAAAARILHPKGKFLMVANRQLPYEVTLEQYFRKWTEISANPRYKVISASVPRRTKG